MKGIFRICGKEAKIIVSSAVGITFPSFIRSLSNVWQTDAAKLEIPTAVEPVCGYYAMPSASLVINTEGNLFSNYCLLWTEKEGVGGSVVFISRTNNVSF